MSSNAVVDFLVEISGDRVLRSTLERLATKETRRAARKALTAGMAITQRALRAAAPPAETAGHSSASLRQDIRSRHQRNKRRGEVEAKVGIGVGKRKYSAAKGNLQRAPHLHLIALGTKDRHTGERTYRVRGRLTRRRKNGSEYTLGKHAAGQVTLPTKSRRAFRGRMYANPFIPQTAGRLGRAVNAHMADVFVEAIEQAAARLSHVPGK